MTNLLASSTSPYLHAHAENPVQWRPWGRDAFVEARDRDVPVLVSIGYSTCHWCHVMAAESFSDPAVGRLLGESVVAIKLDREELPAVDAFYMDALLAMRGQGGWPLNVFTTPDARPFFAGTYFPPEPSGGMPSFSQVVTTIARTWADERERAESIAQSQLASSLVRLPDLSMGLPADSPVPEVDDDSLTAAAENLLAAEDQRWGGFGSLPKFPPTMSLVQLLRRHDRSSTPEVPSGPELAAVRRTFAGISSGGMRDQVDGGITRYSVDAQWHIPHFEKMLFDNALHLRAATHWYVTERGRGASSRYTALAAREVPTTPPASSWSGSSCRAGASHPGSTPIRWTMTGDGRRVRTTWRRGVRSRSRSWRWAPSMPPLLGAPSPSDSRRSPNGCTARQTGPIMLTVPIMLKRPIVLKVLKTQMGPGAVGLRRRAPLRTLLTLALLSPVLLSRAPIRWTRRVVQRRRGRRPRPARLGDSWPSGGPGARCRIATRSS